MCHSPGRDQGVAAGVPKTCLSCVLLSWGHQASCPRLLGDSPVSAQVLLQECQDRIPHPTTSSCHMGSGPPNASQLYAAEAVIHIPISPALGWTLSMSHT